MSEQRSITFKNSEPDGQFDVFDAETGDKIENIYRIEFVVERGVREARLIFSDDEPIRAHRTRVEVVRIVTADCRFSGVVEESATYRTRPHAYQERHPVGFSLETPIVVNAVTKDDLQKIVEMAEEGASFGRRVAHEMRVRVAQ